MKNLKKMKNVPHSIDAADYQDHTKLKTKTSSKITIPIRGKETKIFINLKLKKSVHNLWIPLLLVARSSNWGNVSRQYIL